MSQNRQRLLEISPKNKEYLELVESSLIVAVLDDHEPSNYQEVCQVAVTGDFHSKWADRSSICVAYNNGRFALIGEVIGINLEAKRLSKFVQFFSTLPTMGRLVCILLSLFNSA